MTTDREDIPPGPTVTISYDLSTQEHELLCALKGAAMLRILHDLDEDLRSCVRHSTGFGGPAPLQALDADGSPRKYTVADMAESVRAWLRQEMQDAKLPDLV